MFVIAFISLCAATVTGALGYGFSSISVPLALLFVPSRTLNPALVIIELGVNAYSTFLNRSAVRAILPRVLPMIAGVFPGVLVGALLLTSLTPSTVKLVCYVALLPLIMIQAAGLRFPLRNERAVALPFGLGVGVLYSLTTISGPPLALFFNNQGLAKHEFRVALAVVRLAESSLTLVTYAALGLFTAASMDLALWFIPGVLIGMPLGHLLVKRVEAETFRRVCMSFDAWIVAFGLSRVVHELTDVPTAAAYSFLAATAVLDAVLLRRFFVARSAKLGERALDPAA